MSKFSRCYPANGLMWCQFPNGKYARPWPLSDEKEKPLKEEISLSDDSLEEETSS